MIRTIEERDFLEVLNIYKPFVTDTVTTFETEVPTIKDFGYRIIETIKKYPWLVLEEKGKVIGYAYASEHRSRCSYQWSCECSIYMAPEARGKGFGKKLYLELFKILKAQGFIHVLAGAALPNEASIAIHKSLGFEEIGTYKKIGFKHNRWIDTYWMQLELNQISEPKELIPFSSIGYGVTFK